MEQLIKIIIECSNKALPLFEEREQDSLIRFVYCGVEKVAKVMQGIDLLFKQLDYIPDLEFSAGILARSLVMDMILAADLKKIAVRHKDDTDKTAAHQELLDHSYKLISDGTGYLVNEIYESTKLTEDQKRTIARKFVLPFSKAFVEKNGRYKLKEDYKIKISKIISDLDENDFIYVDTIKNFYSFYSKYDHLSHYTSLPKHQPLQYRKEKLEIVIITTIVHLRDLLAIAYDFDNRIDETGKAILISLIEEVHNRYVNHHMLDGVSVK